MEQNEIPKIEIMMVQLLFKSRPQSPTAEQFRKALEKQFGDLGEVPYAEPSKESDGDMFMFPIPKFKVIMKDKPEGVPVMASFLGANHENGLEVDEEKRYQFWDVPNANEIVDECRHAVLITTMLGAALPYEKQAEAMLGQVEAALECYPECIGIYATQSGKLITPEMFYDFKQYSLSERFIQLFVNVRLFNISENDESVVDTLGLYVFGGADVQVHFKNLDPNHVVNYVYNIATYQFDNDFPIKSGDTIDSIDETGAMQMTPQWNVQYENSMVDPERTVLDVACGEYAGGNR
jgi:hypothetical protein